jgi:molybdate transport system ATP-binding protein
VTLSVDISHRLGAFDLSAAFESSGRLTALYGASGSGKTSLVNIIAGLIRPDRGKVAVDGIVLSASDKGLFVPPHRRGIGYVFQEARLFPHLTVDQNLRYGRFFTAPAKRFVRPDDVVELLGIGHLLKRMPHNLSGGERQRVAIGRALLASPRLLLMDEPLASLDDARKAEILPFIERLRDEANVPIVYVSHSIGEVLRLAMDVIVLSAGRVIASGPAETVLADRALLAEPDKGEAGSLVELIIRSHDDEFGLTELHSAQGTWRLPRIAAEAGRKLRVRVRARDVMLATREPEGISALNVVGCIIEGIVETSGTDALVTLKSGTDVILSRATRKSIHDLKLKPGKKVFALIKSVTFDPNDPAQAMPALNGRAGVGSPTGDAGS